MSSVGQKRQKASIPMVEVPAWEGLEVCKQCPYKRMVEQAMKDGLKSQVSPQVQARQTNISPSQIPVQQDIPISAVPPVVDEPPKGMFARFGAYVKKNQEANRRAGDTSLMDDLLKMGANISSSAAAMGEEEIKGLERKRAVKPRDPDEDEETMDFLMGKRRSSK